MKGTVPLDTIDATALADYAGIVGHLLAKGHARTSGASMIAGYVGSSDKLDRALARFARAYADQTEADHDRWSRRSGPAGSRCSTERWIAWVQPSDPAERRRRTTTAIRSRQPSSPTPTTAGASHGSPPVRLRPAVGRLARAEVGRDRGGPGAAARVGLERVPRRARPVAKTTKGPGRVSSRPQAGPWRAGDRLGGVRRALEDPVHGEGEGPGLTTGAVLSRCR